MEQILVTRYPALTPFEVERTPAKRVFRHIKRLTEKIERDKTDGLGPGEEIIHRDGKTILRRPAGDSWY